MAFIQTLPKLRMGILGNYFVLYASPSSALSLLPSSRWFTICFGVIFLKSNTTWGALAPMIHGEVFLSNGVMATAETPDMHAGHNFPATTGKARLARGVGTHSTVATTESFNCRQERHDWASPFHYGVCAASQLTTSWVNRLGSQERIWQGSWSSHSRW